MTTSEAHARWWANEGSAMRPHPDEDVEQFARRITEIAWSNGAYVEREECAKLSETVGYKDFASDIRARSTT